MPEVRLRPGQGASGLGGWWVVFKEGPPSRALKGHMSLKSACVKPLRIFRQGRRDFDPEDHAIMQAMYFLKNSMDLKN